MKKLQNNTINLKTECFGNTQHKVILGDAIYALDEQITGQSIDLIFAAPPYNIGKGVQQRFVPLN